MPMAKWYQNLFNYSGNWRDNRSSVECGYKTKSQQTSEVTVGSHESGEKSGQNHVSEQWGHLSKKSNKTS